MTDTSFMYFIGYIIDNNYKKTLYQIKQVDMGYFDDLIESTNNMIDEMESDSDRSRSQSFVEEFWEKRRELEDAVHTANEEDKEAMENLLNLFNRKGEEYDLEPY